MSKFTFFKDCEHCEGTGKVFDHVAIGAMLRLDRERHKISVREMARRLGWSGAYVSDLERGRRNWTKERIDRYFDALGEKRPLW